MRPASSVAYRKVPATSLLPSGMVPAGSMRVADTRSRSCAPDEAGQRIRGSGSETNWLNM